MTIRILLILALFVFTVSMHNIEGDFYNSLDMNTDKSNFLNSVAMGDLLSCDSMPLGISVAEMKEIFRVTDSGQSVLLSGRNCTLYTFSAKHQKQPLSAWFHLDTLILLRIWRPELHASTDSVMRSFEKPELIINSNPNFTYPMAQQWVFATKGITLFVNNFQKKISDKIYPEGYIEAAAFYPCTTATYYRTSLGAEDFRRRKPIKK